MVSGFNSVEYILHSAQLCAAAHRCLRCQTQLCALLFAERLLSRAGDQLSTEIEGDQILRRKSDDQMTGFSLVTGHMKKPKHVSRNILKSFSLGLDTFTTGIRASWKKKLVIKSQNVLVGKRTGHN